MMKGLLFGNNLVVCIVIILDIVGVHGKTEDDIFEKYRPLAVDESWSLHQGNSNPTGDSQLDLLEQFEKYPSEVDSYRPSRSFEDEASLDPSSDIESMLTSVDDYKGKDFSDTLFALPNMGNSQTGSKLTSLITGKKTPTFMDPNIAMPTVKVKSMNQTKSDGIIARYKILIPIFVPALKARKALKIKKPTRFVKEEVTKLVPVRKIVPHMKEVIKAEKVPQRLITDYVQANGNTVPSSVSDKVYPGEKVISSVVENID